MVSDVEQPLSDLLGTLNDLLKSAESSIDGLFADLKKNKASSRKKEAILAINHIYFEMCELAIQRVSGKGLDYINNSKIDALTSKYNALLKRTEEVMKIYIFVY